MQKGDIQKLDLYFVGINARFESNLDFFTEIIMEFKSGSKKIIGNFKKDDDKFVLSFSGVKNEKSIKDVFSFFKTECAKYEEANFIYKERGNLMNISIGKKGVTLKKEEVKVEARQSANPLLGDREYKINIDEASDLLRAIGVLTKEGKLKNDMIRKYNQIDRFVELVAPMFENENDILILDCACGKSYLSFVMNYYLREVMRKKCKIIGIDIKEQVISESKRIQKELSYNNMEFIKADLREYVPPKNVTAVISLHACDIATDLALGVAVRSGAKNIACVPCCHKELLNQYDIIGYESVFKHGIFKARFNDLLTDGLRALKLEAEGYKVNVIEYISPLDTPKNILIRAVKEKDYNKKQAEEFDNLVNKLRIYPELIDLCKDNMDF